MPTNVLLFKLSKVETQYCSFCNTERETLIHLFCQCNITKSFWKELRLWLLPKQMELSIQPHSIILGQNCNTPNKTLEFVNLTAKYYIYCCKIQNTIPLLIVFLEKLNYIKEVEKYISLERSTYSKHVRKWKILEA